MPAVAKINLVKPANRTAGFLRDYWFVILAILLVSSLHYTTAIHIHALHGIYRRLYYLPIILAAFKGGTRGGLFASLLVIGLYAPHSFGLIGFDPGTTVEKVLEMVLYLAVGLLTGSLVSRINTTKDRLQETADELQQSLDEKTAMEAELVRSAKLAAVGRLSAGLAHEIRNPLASIKGSAEVLADDYPQEHPKANLMKILLQEADRLNNVLTRFLTFARTEPGKGEDFDMVTEVRAVADLLMHREDAPEVLVTVSGDSCLAHGNREQIRQVILNLGLNAVQEANQAGRVVLALDCEDKWMRCRVMDSGPGFSPEAAANFGTPFFSTKAEGTGLGLATSLRLVENLGGTLNLDPYFKNGACVTLCLPVGRADAEHVRD